MSGKQIDESQSIVLFTGQEQSNFLLVLRVWTASSSCSATFREHLSSLFQGTGRPKTVVKFVYCSRLCVRHGPYTMQNSSDKIEYHNARALSNSSRSSHSVSAFRKAHHENKYLSERNNFRPTNRVHLDVRSSTRFATDSDV